jgi:hypothetical protein
MAKIKDTQEHFRRCQNPQEIPESVCLQCHRTLIAPTVEQLEQLEHQHTCWEERPHATRWGWQTYSV